MEKLKKQYFVPQNVDCQIIGRKKEHKKPVEKVVQKEEVAEVVAAVPPPPKTEPKEEVSAPTMNQNQIDYKFNYGMTLTYSF